MRNKILQARFALCFLLVSVLIISFVNAECGLNLGHPAAAYCTELGYDYKIKDTANGQVGVCVINGVEYDDWNFFNGKIGQEYSYCALNGYEQITKTDGKNPYSIEYAVCVDNGKEIGQVHELMDLESKLDIGILPEINDNFQESKDLPVPLDVPTSFDWRDYQGINWMTSVKNQGSCGSCWAFATLGVVEALHNIKSLNPDLDLDLAEQQLVSDDGECCGAHNYNCGSCIGGSILNSLDYVRNLGIVDEPCSPYTQLTSPCNLCIDWQNRLTYIDQGFRVINNLSYMKQRISEYSPIGSLIGVGPNAGGYWDGNIYRCDIDDYFNHAVVIVGYNDAEEYWMVKNSYGTNWNSWNGEEGYFKLGYGECGVGVYSYYADVAYSFPPVIDSVALTPDTPFSNENLLCTGHVFDNGAENIGEVVFEFYKDETAPAFVSKSNCVEVSSGVFDCVGVLSKKYTHPEENWACQMALNYEGTMGEWITSNVVTILSNDDVFIPFDFTNFFRSPAKKRSFLEEFVFRFFVNKSSE